MVSYDRRMNFVKNDGMLLTENDPDPEQWGNMDVLWQGLPLIAVEDPEVQPGNAGMTGENNTGETSTRDHTNQFAISPQINPAEEPEINQ